MKIHTDDIDFVIDYIITEVGNNNADMAYNVPQL